MTALRRRSSPVAPADLPASFNAPLFHDLVTGLDPDVRHVALDLGAASTGMLELLGRARCCVEVADVAHFSSFSRLNGDTPEALSAEVAELLLPNRLTSEAIDLAFLWDLPNYLTLEGLSSLMAAIRKRAAPGARAHALIVYSALDMPQHPGRFVPSAGGELVNLSAPAAMTAAPRYSPEALGNSMCGFAIDRARLLGNGMQEFLFRLPT